MSSSPESVEKIVAAIRDVAGDKPAALHEPEFSGNEWSYLKDCLDSTYVSSVGAYVDRFENELAAFTGAKHAVAVVNGTAALHLGLLLAGVCRDDEVLIPALTFVATANAVTYCGAVPHFVDSEEITLGIDAEKLRAYLKEIALIRNGHCINSVTGRRIRALVPMHVFGHPSDIEGLMAVARDFHLIMVEDAAESLGSYYQGTHTGTFGLLGTLSFNGNKTITTGGGGAILTDDTDLARQAKHLSTTAKVPHRWKYEHDSIGYNYRMPNLNAALGCAQLEQLPRFIKEKRELYRRYKQAFKGINEVTLFCEPDGCKSNYWLQAVSISSKKKENRDLILAATNAVGLMTRPVWALMTSQEQFSACPGMSLACANDLSDRLINLPSSAGLGANDT